MIFVSYDTYEQRAMVRVTRRRVSSLAPLHDYYTAHHHHRPINTGKLHSRPSVSLMTAMIIEYIRTHAEDNYALHACGAPHIHAYDVSPTVTTHRTLYACTRQIEFSIPTENLIAFRLQLDRFNLWKLFRFHNGFPASHYHTCHLLKSVGKKNVFVCPVCFSL